MQCLQLKVASVSFANAQSGYVVMRGQCRGTSGLNNVTAVGVLTDVIAKANLVGSEYELQGDWKMDPKYGRQFSFSAGSVMGSPLLHFLAKIVKGLGESTARDLVAHYGDAELVKILDNDPDRLLEFKGIKDKKLTKIKESWDKHKCLREISAYLIPAGVTPCMLIRVYNHFGADSVHKLKKNPYCLTEVQGIGFKSSDAVARNLNVAFDSPFRVKAGIAYALLDAAENSGHTCLPLPDLYSSLHEILTVDDSKAKAPAKTKAKATAEPAPSVPEKIVPKVPDEIIASSLDELVGLGSIVSDEKGVSLASYRHMEKWLLSFFMSRSTGVNRPIVAPDKAEEYITKSQGMLGFKFSPDQKGIIHQIAAGRSSIHALLGYAGTGKSTISRALLDFLAEYHCKREEIICCAFTGMASARIKKLTGFPSVTVHSLLKFRGEGKFEFNRDNKLPYRVILLDESSMVNLPLFYRLAQALDDSTIFIMVGDPAQLPPIGAGQPYNDITARIGFPKTTLTAIFRQSTQSVLVHYANMIRLGKMPDEYATADYADFSFKTQDIPNYFALRAELPKTEMKKVLDENNGKIRTRILETVSSLIPHLTHPSWDCQVLTPVRKGILGIETLNPALQQIFNPNGRNPIEAYGIKLKEGDKVMHLKNKDMDTTTYVHGVAPDRDMFTKRRVFNGSVGLITRIDLDNDEFFVVYPERLLVRYEFDHINDLIDLGYCCTVHKAQGSQYKYVIIPMSSSSYIMLNNKWFYTALTRAEKKVFLIGQPFAFRRACTNVDTARRITFLGA